MLEKNIDAPVGKRQKTKEKNRRIILAAAKAAFSAHGYEAVSIRDIIGATDLASGTFYNYFNDKEAVFVAVMKQEVIKVSDALCTIRQAATDLESFIHDSYLHVFRFFHAEPKLFELIDRSEQQIRELYKFGVLGTTMDDLKSDLEFAIASRMIEKVDVDYMAAALYGLGYEMVRVQVNRGENSNPSETAKIATNLILNGLTKPQ